MVSFLSRILAFFKRGWFSRGSQEDFIERIRKGDVDYILKVGVPTIEAPPTPGARTIKYNIIAEGVDFGSLMLLDPEALLYILVSTTETAERVRVYGGGLSVLRKLAEESRKFNNILYGYSLIGRDEIRVLLNNGVVSGLYYERKGQSYTGIEALKVLETEYIDNAVFHLSKVKDKLAEWRDENLSVFVKGLDNQHKYLVNTLNSLYHSTITGEAGKVINTILSRMIDYTKFHFRSEEILMDKYNYPQDRFERHVREHNSFVDAVTKFKERYDRGEADLTLDVFKFLATWVRTI